MAMQRIVAPRISVRFRLPGLVHGARLERRSSSERKIPGSSPGVDEKKGKYKNIFQSSSVRSERCSDKAMVASSNLVSGTQRYSSNGNKTCGFHPQDPGSIPG